MDPLDRLTAVFTDYMEPNDDGEPLVEYKQLPHLLRELGLPDLPFEDLNNNGFIEFEPFINTLSPLLEDEADPHQQQVQQAVFYMLSRGGSEITPQTLRDASKPLGLTVSDEDLELMCKRDNKTSKTEFLQLWRKLHQTT